MTVGPRWPNWRPISAAQHIRQKPTRIASPPRSRYGVHQCEPATRPLTVTGAPHTTPLFYNRSLLAAPPQGIAVHSPPLPAAPLTLRKAHRQVDLMYSGRTVASRVSCSSGNNGSFPPCLHPGFLGFPVVSVNFHLFKAIVRSPASSVVLGICGRSLP
ncbi:hypothetical protein VPH35_065641 [Triticum aestivum]